MVLPAPFGPMTPTMPPRGRLKLRVLDEEFLPETLAEVAGLDHQIPQPGAGRDEELLGFIALLLFLRGQFLEPGEARLALGVPALGAGAHPFQLGLHGLLAGRFLLLLDFESLFLLLQPGRIVALPGDAVAAVQLQDPAGDVIEKIAIVGDGHDGAGVFGQEAFQPGHALRVQVIGRFIEQQHVRVGQQQFAQGDAPAFAAGEPVDIRVPGRQAQGFRRDFQFTLQVVAVAGLQDVFQARLFGGERVEIGIRLGVGGIDRVEFLLRHGDGGQRFLDVAAHRLVRVERRFLGQEADVEAGLGPRLALDFGIHPGHDAQQAGFARTVEAEHADLGAGEEGQGDVFQDNALGRDHLAHAVHGVDVLCHASCNPGAG